MTKQVIKNIVVSTITHIILCVFTRILLAITWSSSNSINLAIIFYVHVLLSIINPLLYYLCGRYFMQNTLNRKNNIQSVAILPIIILCAFIPIGLTDWLIASVSVIASLVAHSVGILGVLLSALFPSIVLYVGIISQKKKIV